MREAFDGVDDDEIVALVRDHWGLHLGLIEYFPEGGGAYHWHAVDDQGAQWFVTVDDLTTKAWLGPDVDATFAALLGCYGAAADLRAGGSDYVLGPLATTAGAPGVRIDDRFSLAVCEHVDGTPYAWGQPIAPGTVDELAAMLARLHATPVPDTVPPVVIEVPDRAGLEAALAAVDQPWTGGPFAAEARAVLAVHADLIRDWLAALDVAAARLASGAAVVLTHGEPHPGNLITTDGGLRLIDWDTVAVAPRERDLWLLAEASPRGLDRYRELTGAEIDESAVAAFRLLWALSDLAQVAIRLRREHTGDAEDERARATLHQLVVGAAPSPYGPRWQDADADDRWNENIEYHRVLLAALPERCERILDFGCGEGILTREAAAARPAARAVGIDPDELSIELARATTAADLQVEYVQGDAMTELEPGSFDAVLSVCALHHVGTAAGLRRCAALVRPGGVVAVEGVARVGWRDIPRAGIALALAVGTRFTRTRWEHGAPIVWPPDVDYRACRAVCEQELPGCRWRHELRGRWTCTWTKPR